ncbi:glyoxalase-like domain-containing protein [Phellopilus nigrolimitatus]|nr:glyoxalase-like domain-containing protein [Phellopilus nigrolimitatus]
MSTKILDHVVHLTPPGSIVETIEGWQKLGFKVIPGGKHADGLTENALVILSDSTYLELISFTHPPEYYPLGSPERTARDAHSWASKAPGWIDFAFLGFGTANPAHSFEPDVDLADVINERAAREGSGAVYERTVPGGRTRPDGQELRWRITAPNAVHHGRGLLPFFCGDVTERRIRVPFDDVAASHPNTSKSVAHIRLVVQSSAFLAVSKQLTSVIGAQPSTSSSTEVSWELKTPTTEGATESENGTKRGIPSPKILLTAAQKHVEEVAVTEQGPGVHEIAFWVERGHEGEEKTPYGRVLLLALN